VRLISFIIALFKIVIKVLLENGFLIQNKQRNLMDFNTIIIQDYKKSILTGKRANQIYKKKRYEEVNYIKM